MKNKFLSFFIALAVFVGIGAFARQKAYAATAKTQTQAAEWAKSQVGTKAVDMDGMYGAQCVDFIQHYYSYLGVFGGGGNACDYAWNTLPSGFTRIEDYYGFVPDPGDIAVWTKGSGGNTCGHVGVVISADLNTLTVADIYGSANETPYRKVHQTTYYYNGGGMQFWGIIRPNFSDASAPSPTQTFDKISEGTYFLYNRATNLALNLGWNNDANCENVHAYEYSTTNRGELMSITSCSDGKTYKIRPIDAKRLVQMYGESPYNGVNVCIYDDLANSTQWWRFKKTGDGYAILIDCNTNYALSSVSGDAVLNNYTGAGNQVWELIPYNPTYTVNYNANGGSGTMPSATFSVGRDTNLAANKFTRAGYTFQGWSKSSSATTASYADKALVADLAGGASSVTLYAVWKADPVSTYTIKYDGNGNTSGYMSDTKATYNTSVNLQKNSYKNFGSRFKGWSTNKNATTAEYSDGQAVKNLAQSGTVTLYAVWEHIEVPQLNGLKAANITENSVALSWDKIDVDGYEIWQDNVLVAKVTSTSFTVTGLKPATTYSFDVMPYIEGASYSIGSGKTITTLSGIETVVGAAAAGNSNNSSAASNSSEQVAAAEYPSASSASSSLGSGAGNVIVMDSPSAPSGSTSSSVTPSSSASTGGTTSNITASSNTSKSDTTSSSASVSGTALENTSAGNGSNNESKSANNEAKKTGLGVAISSSIWAIVHWIKKLTEK